MYVKLSLIIVISLIILVSYLYISITMVKKISESKEKAINFALGAYKPSMSFESVSAYLDKLITDEYTLKYQLNILLEGKYFLHDYDKEEVQKELSSFAENVIKMISKPMQRELEYYYNADELERMIVRRCNLLLMAYVDQKKEEKMKNRMQGRF